MKIVKKSLMTILMILSFYTCDLKAQDYGFAYQESREAPVLKPSIALTAITVIAIIAVAMQNAFNDHGHCHVD